LRLEFVWSSPLQADLLLREVEASAEDRCVEPQPLNAAVIQQIMGATAEKVN
jgi:hypothetical protein